MRWRSAPPMSRSGTAPISKAAACRMTRGATPISIGLQESGHLLMRSHPSVPMAAKAAPARLPTSRMWSSDRKAGFTLLETVAVMLIIALMASLAITMIPGTGRARLKAVTLDAAALLRRERLGAILTGREREVAIDGERRILIGDGGSTVALPPDVVVDLLGTTVPSMDRATVVRFHPDGASSGAVLRLSREKAGYEIRVNWYTGGVSIEAR